MTTLLQFRSACRPVMLGFAMVCCAGLYVLLGCASSFGATPAITRPVVQRVVPPAATGQGSQDSAPSAQLAATDAGAEGKPAENNSPATSNPATETRLQVQFALQDSPALQEADRSLGQAEQLQEAVSDYSDDDFRPIGQLTIETGRSAGDSPEDLAATRFASAGEIFDVSAREPNWMQYSYYWQASSFCHYPLYFEDVNLERYGYSACCLQPVVSGVHFFGTIPLLPYKMADQHPGECVYTLGHGRPGSYAPYYHYRRPLSLDGVMAEAGAVAGLILLIP